ncbi:Non-histone protein 10 [Chionoecetes opilio]|uniref:Non-histone protein 10 n=1 Tax=Chionoecetes opilio TaxID=41210 RepID=A0A8J4YPM1_CHIOP|nr:Non-histone protein 10 [Chionoecetes opilio]
MLVNRVYRVKRMVQRLRRERRHLMEELDRRGDNYHSLPLTIAIEEDEKAFALPQVRLRSGRGHTCKEVWDLKTIPELHSFHQVSHSVLSPCGGGGIIQQTSSLPALGRPRSSGSSLNSRRQPQVKRERVERDAPAPAPKRPSNAFLQFCQEQREAATAQHLQQTGRAPDKKQLTRQLASRWNALPEDDKKTYLEKYERDKERHSGDKAT